MYDPSLSRFMTLDPKAETYSFQTPYAYAANNPVLFVDQNGENPALPLAVAAQALTYAAIAGTIYLSYVIIDRAVDNTNWDWQRKKDREAKRDVDQRQANVEKSIKDNVSEPTPDGSVDPQGGGSGNKLIDAVVIGGLTGLVVEGVINQVDTQGDKRSSDDNSSSNSGNNNNSDTNSNGGDDGSGSSDNAEDEDENNQDDVPFSIPDQPVDNVDPRSYGYY